MKQGNMDTGFSVNVQNRATKDTGMETNPDSTAAHASAMRTVLLYLLTEAFALSAEEQIWSGWVLDETCADLLDLRPHTVPIAVRQEMLNSTYSRLLEMHGKQSSFRSSNVYDSKVVHASAEEWADALLVPLQASYTLHPLTETRMKNNLVKLLADLGVGAEQNPRGATHLPTELRYKVLADRSAR